MKYAFQFALIISISFIGEILNMLIPLPVPASIYGLVILFFCLELKIIKLHQVKEAGDFLLVMMPVMFVPSSVGFMTAFPVMKKYGLCFLVIAVVTTFCVVVITGHIVQLIIRAKNKKTSKEN